MATNVATTEPSANAVERTDVGDEPTLLEPRPGGAAERFAEAIGDRHPVTAFFAALVSGYVVLAAASIALGLVVTNVLLEVDAVRRLDRRLPHWLATERSEGWTDASWVGTELAGGYVVPVALGLIGLVMAALRKWRVAAYVVFAVAVESATYRATTLVVERRRPEVERLESLPIEASYPSGHTAASVALYCGLALLLTSGRRIAGASLRTAIWAIAIAIPPIVALSRIYRGMHHPIDALAGVPIGIAAIVVAAFACRVAGSAIARRATAEAR